MVLKSLGLSVLYLYKIELTLFLTRTTYIVERIINFFEAIGNGTRDKDFSIIYDATYTNFFNFIEKMADYFVTIIKALTIYIILS